jgi:hypothetical protein
VLVRSTISLTQETGEAIRACEGAALCGFAGLAKETPAAATGVDIAAPRAFELGDLFWSECVVIFLSFPNLLFV